ncbi:MAG: type II toxin-antitoxin system HigB family toxin [Gammaproteobacteria bacterium]|nr:type II toxin-antitoxin system HigB family toxin [Gammaproteobacteria bacterium]
MRVISNRKLRDFADQHTDATRPLQSWRKAMETAKFRSFADLRRAFGSVDRVGDLCVFDIGGNKYRLIAYIRFDWNRCYIKSVLTHSDYDSGKWRKWARY